MYLYQFMTSEQRPYQGLFYKTSPFFVMMTNVQIFFFCNKYYQLHTKVKRLKRCTSQECWNLITFQYKYLIGCFKFKKKLNWPMRKQLLLDWFQNFKSKSKKVCNSISLINYGNLHYLINFPFTSRLFKGVIKHRIVIELLYKALIDDH